MPITSLAALDRATPCEPPLAKVRAQTCGEVTGLDGGRNNIYGPKLNFIFLIPRKFRLNRS